MNARTPFALLANATAPAVGGSARVAGGRIRRQRRRPSSTAARGCAPGSACREGGGVAAGRRAGLRCRQHAGRRPQPAVRRRLIRRSPPRHPQAHLFEREVWEQHGLVPEGHPWLKPVRRDHGAGPADGRILPGGRPRDPRGGRRPGARGHHRAGAFPLPVRRRGGAAPGDRARLPASRRRGGAGRAARTARRCSQMETVAGDTTIAHATAYATVLEALAGTEAPLRAQWLRAIALELERLANHTGDLGALANDVAFLPTAVGLRQDPRRFPQPHRAAVRQPFRARPGPARRLPARPRAGRAPPAARPAANVALAEVEQAAAWLWDAASVRARFEDTGTVSRRPGGRDRPGGPGGARLRAGARRAFRSSGGLASLRAGARGGVAGRRRLRPRPRALAGDPALRRVPARAAGHAAGGRDRCATCRRPRRTRWRWPWSKAGAAKSATWR